MVVMQIDEWFEKTDRSEEIYASKRYIDESIRETPAEPRTRTPYLPKTCVICGKPKSQNGDICRECRTAKDQVVLDAEKLNELLHADGRKIHTLGKLGGVSKGTIYQMSCGLMATCKLKTAERLAEILGVDVFSFCTRTKEEPDVSH